MNTAIVNKAPLRWLTDNLGLLLRRPPRMQVAALCYRDGDNGPEVLLITSRTNKRWIIPKGWPMANLPARNTAGMEAFEEAGIVGKPGKKPIGDFISRKGLGNGFKVRTNTIVFPLRVEKQCKKFPEKGQRKFVWLPVEEAAAKCTEPGLGELLLSDHVKSLLTEIK